MPCKLFLLLEGPAASAGGSGDAGGSPDRKQQPLHDGQQLAGAEAPPGFSIKRQFRLAMRRGVHMRLLVGQRAAEAEAEERRALQQQQHVRATLELHVLDDSSEDSSEGGGGDASSDGGSGSSGGGMEESPGEAMLVSQAPPEEPADSFQAPPPAAAGSCVWYLCQTTPKGLNAGKSGGGAGGMAQSFDGL